MKIRILIISTILLAGCSSTSYRGNAVRERINDVSSLAAHDVSIEEQSAGVITLNGNVASHNDREKIESLARSTQGVTEIHSNLVVGPSRVRVHNSSSVDSHALRTIVSDISSQISASPTLRNYYLMVNALGDSVTLSGQVQNESERQEAERIARDTRGVRFVRNDIELTRFRSNDFQITEELRAVLRRSSDINDQNINIYTRDSIVTLSGWQRSNRDIDRVLAITWAISGVTGVKNELRVGDNEYRHQY